MNVELFFILVIGIIGLIIWPFIYPIHKAMLKCWSVDRFVFAPQLFKLKLQGIPYEKIVDALVEMRQAGLKVSLSEVEAIYRRKPRAFFENVKQAINEFEDGQNANKLDEIL